MENITIAIQKKGRLYEESMKFFSSLNIEFPKNGSKLKISSITHPIDLLLVRSHDVAEYIDQGVADFGIVGENVLIEDGKNISIVKKLGFGGCKLVIAVPKESDIKKISDLEGERISTSYPNTLKNFLIGNNVKASIIKISGSVEVAPSINLADCVCDITQTGNTLREHGLSILCDVISSQAVLISGGEKWEF